MSVLPDSPIPAGWYPDPAGSFQQRWWDGAAWTNDFAQYRPTLIHSAPAAEALRARADALRGAGYGAQQNVAATQLASGLVAQPAATPTQAQTIGRDTSVGQPNAGTAALIAVTPVSSKYVVPAVNPTFSNNYLPFSSIPEVRPGDKQLPEQRHTVSAWFMAGSPLLFVGAALTLATIAPVVYTTFIQAIMLLLFVFLTIALAVRDRYVLHREGHDLPASPAWVLVTPLAYLIARSVSVTRETGRGALGPLMLLLAVIAVIAVALVVVPGLSTLLITATALY